MGLSSAGIGSGLDVASIVSQLVAADRVPLDNLKAREVSFNARLSAYGSIKSAVATFQTSLNALTKTGLNVQSFTSGNPAMLSGSAGGEAISGTYQIAVEQLAVANKQISAGIVDGGGLAIGTKTKLGSGTLSFEIAGKTVAIPTTPSDDYTLEGLTNAINNSGAGVVATVINDGTVNRLVVTAKDSGVANTVQITGTGALAQFSTASMTQQPAKDAKFTIDGVNIIKSSNTVTDAIAGVTLTLSQINTAAVPSTNLTIARDDTAVKANVAAFVKSYNAINTTIRGLTAYDPATKKGGALNGDSGATAVLAAMRREISKATEGTAANGDLPSLGITFQRDGSLAIDDAKLQKAMAGNSSSLAQIFTGADGVATRLSSLTTNLLSDAGIIATKSEGLNASIKSTIKQGERMAISLNMKEQNYRRQFTSLDGMIASMSTTSSFLQQQLSSLAY